VPPLIVQLTSSPRKYLDKLDRTTRDRIKEKLIAVANNPEDTRLSYPLENSNKRCTRIGKYRVLFTLDANTLLVADIDSRGQVYRNA
jgi:mRNA-degrading endonuclease RelE of RelBE toxin-antitoxin system